MLPRAVPILCYHNVSDRRVWRFRHYILPVRVFARQMRWLKAHGWEAITLDRLLAYLQRGEPLPPKPVVITFDDGYQEHRHTATPLLAELGLPHTHFLTTGKLGATTDWVVTAPNLPLLSPEDVRQMAVEHGEVVDFQPHGHHHTSMEGIDPETARREVLESIRTVEQLSGRPARHLAYPYGDYDERTPALMRELPLESAFTVNRGMVRPGQDPFLLPRVEVFANDFWFDFRFKLRLGWSPLSSLRIYAGGLLERLTGLAARLVRGGARHGGT
jgi:peptidoglycan/xylan/chitin deacetylase (PgdA/CDA1 family)